jgi:hypothetical protein
MPSAEKARIYKDLRVTRAHARAEFAAISGGAQTGVSVLRDFFHKL